MRFDWDGADDPTDTELKAVVMLLHRGKISDGAVLNRQKLAELLGCTHGNAPCGTCMNQRN